MKIIVTGGAGFIASHVVDAYIAAGHTVAIVDNLSTGSRNNINPRAKFYEADIRELDALRKIFKREQPDIVNHHAAFISVTDSVKKPDMTFAINAIGTLNVVLAFADPAVTSKKKKILFSSTGGAIYGNPKRLPADERTTPNPLSPYGLTKQIDEEIIRYFSRENNLRYTIFRYANVYGPRQRAQGGAGVVPIFTDLISRGIRPTIFGNGKKTRDYVYVEDVAQASVRALTRGDQETINIATGREISDYDVFKALADGYRFTQKPLLTPKRPGEVERISLSFARAKKILGWEPKILFKEGIQKTIAANAHSPSSNNLRAAKSSIGFFLRRRY
jgi:UDP-glucose 4-epimerase